MKTNPIVATTLTLLAFCLCAIASSVPLAWDAVPGATGYYLYASTNTITATNLSSAPVKVATGTNTTVRIEDLGPSLNWKFVATAVVGGVESDPSNQLVVQAPPAPANMKTLSLQYSANLTNWFDVLFFKIKIGP